MKAFNRQLMAKSPRVMTAVFYVICLRLCIIFSRLSVNRPQQLNYRSLLLLTKNTRKIVTHKKIGIGKLQLRVILSPGRERGIWASNAGASRVIREVSHVCSRLSGTLLSFICLYHSIVTKKNIIKHSITSRIIHLFSLLRLAQRKSHNIITPHPQTPPCPIPKQF